MHLIINARKANCTKRGTLASVIGAAALCLALAAAPNPAAALRASITNGEDSAEHEFPYMAAIYFADAPPAASQYCGGVLIHPSYVLTAAHCAETARGYAGGAPTAVRLGSRTLSGSAGTSVLVDDYAIHPGYVSGYAINDIGLLHLQEPVSVPTASIASPADLNLWAAGTEAVMIGWGRMDPKFDVLPDILQKASAPIISDEQCQAADGRLYVAGQMLCAGKLGATPGTGTGPCYGDSGGPLLAAAQDGYKIVGLTSWGLDCGSDRFYGVFTKTAAYYSWVQAVLYDRTPPTLASYQFNCTEEQCYLDATFADAGEFVSGISSAEATVQACFKKKPKKGGKKRLKCYDPTPTGDTSSVVANTVRFSVPPLHDFIYIFAITARDQAGNQNSTPFRVRVKAATTS